MENQKKCSNFYEKRYPLAFLQIDFEWDQSQVEKIYTKKKSEKSTTFLFISITRALKSLQ